MPVRGPAAAQWVAELFSTVGGKHASYQMPTLGSVCGGEVKYLFPRRGIHSQRIALRAELPQRLCYHTREGARLLYFGLVEDRPVTDSGPSVRW